jgi:hypothetical protein
MTYANRTKAAENLPALPNVAFHSSSHVSFGLKQIFVGSNGLRAGWRLFMFLDLFGVLWGGIALIRAAGRKPFRSSTRTKATLQSRRF